MTDVSVPAVLGVPDFELIHIDPRQTAAAFQSYLVTASKLTGVSLDDISTSVSPLPQDPQNATLVQLLESGMKLFDAIVWIRAGRPASHPLVLDAGLGRERIPSLHNVARAVFYCYFMLVVQARYPASRETADPPKVPNFLSTIMGMDEPPHVYVDRISSFAPQKFDPSWVKYVNFNGFGQEVLSRFGLGVAGYRMFGPFALYRPKAGISAELAAAVQFATTVAKARPTWAVHPLTRSPEVLTRRGNLNKNLGNLILEVFSEEDIAQMVAAKVIFARPTMEPTHRNYTTWTATDDISGNDLIFA